MDIRIIYILSGIVSSLLISSIIRARTLAKFYSNIYEKFVKYFNMKNKVLIELVGLIPLTLLIITFNLVYIVPPWLVLLYIGSNNAELGSLMMGQIIGYVGILSISSRIKKK